MNKNQKFVLIGGIIVIILILLFLGTANERQFSGYIRGISETNDLVLIDEIDFLTGDQAINKAVEVTECDREEITECAPSLNNNFYIHNADTTTIEYTVAPNVAIDFLQTGTSTPSEDSFDELRDAFENETLSLGNLPFNFTAEGDVITKIELQYIP